MRSFVRGLVEKTPLSMVFRKYHEMLNLRRSLARYFAWTEKEQKQADFYRQFIMPGDLVFDVGANMGARIKIFLRLEGDVVAIEPQKICTDFLEVVLRKDTRFKLEKCALGANVGTEQMMVSHASTISSLSPQWVDAVKASGRFSNYEWGSSEVVQVETLENMIIKHGVPAFVKIDVEGYESEVLSGLKTLVKTLSFEFTSEYIDCACRCVERLLEIHEYEFQISMGVSMEFSLKSWVGRDEILEELSRLASSNAFGDVYARRLD